MFFIAPTQKRWQNQGVNTILPPEIYCIECGKKFQPDSNRSYLCSVQCKESRQTKVVSYSHRLVACEKIQHASTSPKKEKYCERCGTLFTSTRIHGFCSEECRKLTYKERKARNHQMKYKSTFLRKSDTVSMRDAYDNFKPLSEQVKDRFKEAQGDHGKLDAASASNIHVNGTGPGSGKIRPNMKRK